VAQRRFGLGPHRDIVLILLGTPLAVADDGQSSAGFLDHRCRGRPGMGAAVGRVTVLRTDGEPAGPRHGRRNQGEGRANRYVDAARGARRLADLLQLAELGEAAVHLPVADDELAAHVHWIP
jgi:hypothetical protein